jgi:isopentenyl-diphosphate Delta-isomerase
MEDEVRVILVDENDCECGFMEKMEAHRKAVLHRAISVFITNSKGEWLLQRRSADKYHSRGLWTNTCCSHPFPGESVQNAARRRLAEEMGLVCDLHHLFSFIYMEKLDNDLTEHELDHVFHGITDDQPVLNLREVMEWKYISFSDLQTEVITHPLHYSVWFRKILEKVNQFIILSR